jgi:hypothetical protein
MHIQDIRCVTSILHAAPGNMSSAAYREAVEQYQQSMCEPRMDNPIESDDVQTSTIIRLQTTRMTDEEAKLPSLSYRKT